MDLLKSIDEALGQVKKAASTKNKEQAPNGPTTSSQKTASTVDYSEVAKTAAALGQLHGVNFIIGVVKAAHDLKSAEESHMRGGRVSGSRISEPGSVTDQTNALPTNKDNPGKKLDESKSVKHLTEDDIKTPTKVQASETRINSVSK